MKSYNKKPSNYNNNNSTGLIQCISLNNKMCVFCARFQFDPKFMFFLIFFYLLWLALLLATVFFIVFFHTHTHTILWKFGPLIWKPQMILFYAQYTLTIFFAICDVLKATIFIFNEFCFFVFCLLKNCHNENWKNCFFKKLKTFFSQNLTAKLL